MQAQGQHKEHSDSEDDSDYVPPADVASDSDSADDERDAKRVKASPPNFTAVEEAEKKRVRDELWASFQASVSNSSNSTTRPPEVKLVKIEKRYRYAGEDVIEVVEVPEASEDAKKWPLWRPPINIQSTTEDASAKAEEQTLNDNVPSSDKATQGTRITTSPPSASSSSSTPTPTADKPVKRPGPRRPKTKLKPLPEPSKAKKLTTLDKSAMDWKAHVSTASDASLKDELNANRRGGGYLEKVEFLQRVEERKDQAFEANKSTKRRRG